MSFQRVAVFCGSSNRVPEHYLKLAGAVGTELAKRGIGVVYGGGRVGLMGAVADHALAAGGEVIGVIPHALHDLELGHTGVTQLEVVDTMHTRKARMAELSDAFIALPGGFGTWEEIMEAVTWTQLGYHRKPVGLLNHRGFYDPLVAQVELGVREGFIAQAVSHLLAANENLGDLLETLQAAELPALTHWLKDSM